MDDNEALRRWLWIAWQLGGHDVRLMDLPWYVNAPKLDAYARRGKYHAALFGVPSERVPEVVDSLPAAAPRSHVSRKPRRSSLT